MKILFISKYPPIEGYVSSCTYWLARGLASRGHRITVVTNAFEVEDDHRELLSGPDLDEYQKGNLRVRNTDPFQSYRLIPRANPFCEKLAAAAVEESAGASLLDAWYLVSYGSAGMLAKAATGLPLILRHAGSDLGRLAENPHLGPLVRALLRGADAVVASRGSAPRLRELGARGGQIAEIPVSVDSGAFRPSAPAADLGTDAGIPVMTYIGKIARGKGVRELLAAAARVREDFRLLLLSSAAGNLGELRMPPRLKGKVIVRPFVAPWRMPGIIRASRCVVMPEHHFPVRGHSPVLPREVLACGTCLMVSGELRAKVAGGMLEDGQSALVVDPERIDDFADRMRAVVKDEELAIGIGKAGHRLSTRTEDFEGYLSANERLYRKIA